MHGLYLRKEGAYVGGNGLQLCFHAPGAQYHRLHPCRQQSTIGDEICKAQVVGAVLDGRDQRQHIGLRLQDAVGGERNILTL